MNCILTEMSIADEEFTVKIFVNAEQFSEGNLILDRELSQVSKVLSNGKLEVLHNSILYRALDLLANKHDLKQRMLCFDIVDIPIHQTSESSWS